MFINVRLRDGRDADIETWYIAQDDRSEAVRQAIRAYIQSQSNKSQEVIIKDAVTTAISSQETIVKDAVVMAMSDGFDRLPDLVAGAVRDALAGYQLKLAQEQTTPGEEDPELAARLDAQLDEFFKDKE